MKKDGIYVMDFLTPAVPCGSPLSQQGFIFDEQIPWPEKRAGNYTYTDANGNIVDAPVYGQTDLPAFCFVRYAGKYPSPPPPGYEYLFFGANTPFEYDDLYTPPIVGPASSPAEPPQLVPNAPAQAPTAAIVPIQASAQSVATGEALFHPVRNQPAKEGELVSSSRKKDKPRSYYVAQELFRKYKVLCIGNGLYVYDGRLYHLLTKEEMFRFIMGSCRDVIAEVGSASFIEDIYKAIYAEPAIVRKPAAPAPDILPLEDGVLNTRTWELHPYSSDMFLTSMVKASFTRGLNMPCPTFDRFVADTGGGDPLHMRRTWEALGYILTQDMRGKCFVVLQGVPNSGKSLLGNFIRSCFDDTAVTSLDINSFAKQFAMADMIGKRLCVDLDLPGAALNAQSVSILKKLTGGDPVPADIKYMPRVTFVNTAKLLFATNFSVTTQGLDSALYERLVVVPFRYAVPRERQNYDLLAQFEAERDGIVVKALRYYAQLRDRHYIFSGNFRPNEVCSQGYASSIDFGSIIAGFIINECEPNNKIWTPTRELFAEFSAAHPGICNLNTFSEYVNTFCEQNYGGKVYNKRRRCNGEQNPIHGYKGLALKSGKGGELDE